MLPVMFSTDVLPEALTVIAPAVVRLPLRFTVPCEMPVVPLQVFVPLRVRLPELLLLKKPAPEILPESVWLRVLVWVKVAPEAIVIFPE